MKDKICIKIISLLLILIFLMFSLSGCSNLNNNNIDKLAYVVALGFDIGSTNRLKMSFQISIPGGGGSGDSGSGSGTSQSSNVIVNTIECSSINSGINLLNSYISKRINLSHCKVVVFSEELAYQGLNEYIYTLNNDIELGPLTNVVISKSDAKSFLENSKPAVESLSARYYEIAPTSSQYTGYTVDVKLGSFFSSIADTFSDPYAILGSVNTPSTHKKNAEGTSQSKDSSYTAGETPIDTSYTNLENMGLAVFSGDKMVGELNGIETICHLLVIGQLETCVISIPSPFTPDETIDLKIKLNKKTKNKVEFVNSSPFISVDVNLKSTILSMNKDRDYLSEENLELLESYANSYLEENISSYLYKTSKEFHSDIAGFGKYAVSNFLFWQDWKDYNWLSNYQNAFFTVHVSNNIRSGQLLLKT